jgi:hypothetical protein
MEKQTLRFTTLRRETQKAFCFNDFPPVQGGLRGVGSPPLGKSPPLTPPQEGENLASGFRNRSPVSNALTPTIIASRCRNGSSIGATSISASSIPTAGQLKFTPSASLRAGSRAKRRDHWNEEGDYHYYSEHPEIRRVELVETFGRGVGYDYPREARGRLRR